MPAKILTLALNSIYFDQIKAGEKIEEYRLCTPYWNNRLLHRSYDFLTLTKGYPARDDLSRRMTFLWQGYVIKTIQHEHFGEAPAQVFAIKIAENPILA